MASLGQQKYFFAQIQIFSWVNTLDTNKKHNFNRPGPLKVQFCFAYLPNPAGQSKWAKKRQPASPEWCPTCHRAPGRCNTHSCKRPTFRVNKNYQYNERHNSNRNPCVEEFDDSIIQRGPHGVNKQKKDVEFHMYIS